MCAILFHKGLMPPNYDYYVNMFALVQREKISQEPKVEFDQYLADPYTTSNGFLELRVFQHNIHIWAFLYQVIDSRVEGKGLVTLNLHLINTFDPS